MRKLEFFQTFAEDYTQRKRSALFRVKKEENRKPIGTRSNIGVKIDNDELN